jgi:hypothetical protein
MMSLQVRTSNSEVWRQRFGLSAGRASTRTLSPVSGKNRTSSRTAGEILICGRLVLRLWHSPAEQMSPVCGQVWRFHIDGKGNGRDPDCVAGGQAFELSVEFCSLWFARAERYSDPAFKPAARFQSRNRTAASGCRETEQLVPPSSSLR